MSWLFLALFSAAASAGTRILQKVLLKSETNNALAFSVVFQLSVALIFLSYTLVSGTFSLPNLDGLIGNFILLALLYSLSNLLVFNALRLAQASEVTIILTSGTAWSVVAALVFLGESLNYLQVMGIVLILAGVVAVNYTRSGWQIGRGHALALLGAMFFGLAFVNDAFIISRFESVASYMVIAFALPGFLTLAYQPRAAKGLPAFFRKEVVGKLLLCSTLYALAAWSLFSAYKLGGPASIISPLHQLSVVLTVLFGVLFLNERSGLGRKLIGTTLVMIGAILLT